MGPRPHPTGSPSNVPGSTAQVQGLRTFPDPWPDKVGVVRTASNRKRSLFLPPLAESFLETHHCPEGHQVAESSLDLLLLRGEVILSALCLWLRGESRAWPGSVGQRRRGLTDSSGEALALHTHSLALLVVP